MDLLILGGTRFLGRHLAAAARARGHRLTLFHRGTRVPEPEVETIVGDRNRDLAKLQGRRWDAVVDSSGYHPQTVRRSAEALQAAVGQYVFISSVSVYADLSVSPGVDETAALAGITAAQLREASAIDTSGQVTAATYGRMYGGLKALCEAAAAEVFPGRVLTIRPGLVVGAHDYTDRFTWWPVRVARGGEVLAPGDPRRYVQFIDARDLAEWVVEMIERRQSGVFNANGPPATVTMEALLDTCRAVSGSDAHFTWVSDSFLLSEHVTPWTELPLWLPHNEGLMSVDVRKAVAAGLRHRPLDETVGDVLQWYREHGQGRTLRAGLAPERERALLRKWSG